MITKSGMSHSAFFINGTILSKIFYIVSFSSVRTPSTIIQSRLPHCSSCLFSQFNFFTCFCRGRNKELIRKLAGNKYRRDRNTKYSWWSKYTLGWNLLQNFFSSERHVHELKKTPIQLISTLNLRILPLSALEHYKAITIIRNITKLFSFLLPSLHETL